MKTILNLIGKFYAKDPLQALILIANLIVSLILLIMCIQETYFNFRILIISFIPFLISLFIYIIRLIFDKNKFLRYLTDGLIALLIIPFFFFHIIAFTSCILSIYLDEYPTNDINKYQKLRPNEEYLPAYIPENVSDVNMYYNTGILQAGTYLVLYYKTDDNEIDYYVNNYDKLKDNVSQTAVETLGNRIYYDTPYESGLNEDFIKYQIYASCDDSGYCNHGIDKHYAINNKTNEIIFYYATW